MDWMDWMGWMDWMDGMDWMDWMDGTDLMDLLDWMDWMDGVDWVEAPLLGATIGRDYWAEEITHPTKIEKLCETTSPPQFNSIQT